MLSAAGLPELVTQTMEQYEELAVKLAKDTKGLWELRQKMEAAREECPLFDTERWVRDFEQCLGMAWERHEQGLAPAAMCRPRR